MDEDEWEERKGRWSPLWVATAWMAKSSQAAGTDGSKRTSRVKTKEPGRQQKPR